MPPSHGRIGWESDCHSLHKTNWPQDEIDGKIYMCAIPLGTYLDIVPAAGDSNRRDVSCVLESNDTCVACSSGVPP